MSFKILKFIGLLLIFSFLTFMFWMDYDYKSSIQIVALCWSLYILCFPANHGAIFLGVPFELITNIPLYYPELIMWPAAILLNIYTYFTNPQIYFASLPTHLLFRIITTPWPYWMIIFICSLGTFYKFFVGIKNFRNEKIKHYIVRTFIICLGIFTLLVLSYKEFIIIFNIRV